MQKLSCLSALYLLNRMVIVWFQATPLYSHRISRSNYFFSSLVKVSWILPPDISLIKKKNEILRQVYQLKCKNCSKLSLSIQIMSYYSLAYHWENCALHCFTYWDSLYLCWWNFLCHASRFFLLMTKSQKKIKHFCMNQTMWENNIISA